MGLKEWLKATSLQICGWVLLFGGIALILLSEDELPLNMLELILGIIILIFGIIFIAIGNYYKTKEKRVREVRTVK